MSDEAVFPVVVIGGGLAGLSAATHLADQGVAPLVLEASSLWPGGRLCGGEPDKFEYKGRIWSFKPDHGVHALWGGYVNMADMIDRFLDVELQESQGEAWINRWQREVRVIEAGSVIRSTWIPAPFHYLQLLFRPRFWTTITPLDFLSLPGFLVSLLLAIGFDPLEEQRPLDGLTMREFFRGWTPNLRATFTGVGTNLLAASEDEISLTGLITALRFYTLNRRTAWHMRFFRGNSHDHLIQPLIDVICSKGGQVAYGVTALSLERVNDHWRIVVEDDGKRGLRSIFSENIILATNSTAAKRLLMAHSATGEAAQHMNFPSALRTFVVRLWFDAEPLTSADSGMFTGDFEIDNYFWLHRLYDEFSDWRSMGGSAIEVHIYGSERMLDQPDRNLLITAINEVQRAFPELRGHFIHGVVRRNSRAHTRFRVPDAHSLYVDTPWDGIFACGDWIGYPTPSMWMERAVTTGKAAANRVLTHYGKPTHDILQPQQAELLVRILSGFVRVLRIVLRPILTLLRSGRR